MLILCLTIHNCFFERRNWRVSRMFLCAAFLWPLKRITQKLHADFLRYHFARTCWAVGLEAGLEVVRRFGCFQVVCLALTRQIHIPKESIGNHRKCSRKSHKRTPLNMWLSVSLRLRNCNEHSATALMIDSNLFWIQTGNKHSIWNDFPMCIRIARALFLINANYMDRRILKWKVEEFVLWLAMSNEIVEIEMEFYSKKFISPQSFVVSSGLFEWWVAAWS